MSNSTNLTLPFLTLGQAQKHVTVNESLLRLDALVQLAVVSATTTTEPGSPSDGQIYILPTGKTGTHWGAMANNALAYYRDGVWEEITPREGFVAYVKDTDLIRSYSGSSWTALSSSVTFAATDKVLGRVSSGGGAAEEVTFTDQAQALCDDASFGAMRTTLAAAGLADANVFTAAQTVQLATDAPLKLQCDDNGSGGGPKLDLYRNSASPASSDYTGEIQFNANNSAGSKFTLAKNYVQMQDHMSGSEDAIWFLETMVAGASGARIRVSQGVQVGSPTGSDKGVGTLNAVAVYDDNTLLTCGPLELMLTDAVDLEKWDALVPNIEHEAVYEGDQLVREAYVEERRHEVMHAFAAMRAEGFDPRDPANFVARMKQDGAVPGLMTETEWRDRLGRSDKVDMGTMQTRTFLALDNLAVAFANVVERLEALERLSGARG
jgi:hypothetical protein